MYLEALIIAHAAIADNVPVMIRYSVSLKLMLMFL
jgi:hypothetical protein